jgi:hypothetical protein
MHMRDMTSAVVSTATNAVATMKSKTLTPRFFSVGSYKKSRLHRENPRFVSSVRENWHKCNSSDSRYASVYMARN